MCELLEVSPADYYDCEVGRKAFGLPQTKKIREQIAQAHVESRGTYGRRRSASGTIFHSDRGSQYASEDFRNILKVFGMRASMSRKAECWDNACVESFFNSMKREHGDPIWDSRAIAQATIFDYIEIWYNRKRRHSTLGYVSPEEYESSLPTAA